MIYFPITFPSKKASHKSKTMFFKRPFVKRIWPVAIPQTALLKAKKKAPCDLNHSFVTVLFPSSGWVEGTGKILLLSPPFLPVWNCACQ